MTVLRARRGATGSKYLTFRGGLRRAIPFLLVGPKGAGARYPILYVMPEAGMRPPGVKATCVTASSDRKVPPGTRPG
jgi:hypothetical protein